MIKSFGDVQNNFSALFVDVQAKIKEFLFLYDEELCGKYRIREGSTYKKAIKIVDNHYEVEMTGKN